VAFNKLEGCDSSDMAIWATSAMSENFLKEIMVPREQALGRLIKKPTEEDAAIVRAYDRVVRLMEEAANIG
jgi:hypothetical protein